MAKRTKRTIGIGILCSIAREHLGFAGAKNVSLFTLVAKVLSSHGVARKDDVTDREYVVSNEQVLREIHGRCKNPARREKLVIKYETEWMPSSPIDNAPSVSQSEARSSGESCGDGSDVTGDAFLKTYKWRQLRMMAIKLHGPRCQCCGASAATGAVINVDHIKPRRQFPELALVLDNLQILCADCNHGKGNWDRTDWRGCRCRSFCV